MCLEHDAPPLVLTSPFMGGGVGGRRLYVYNRCFTAWCTLGRLFRCLRVQEC